MLSRVADNLFWMGRYIERSEHTARFMNVNYFSSLDAPNTLSQSRQFVLESLYTLVSEENASEKEFNEDEVLYNVALNNAKSYSIINCVKYARENANSSRDSISSEFYESINKYYHYINNYPKDVFVKSGLHDFTTNIIGYSEILRGKIRGTLLHDEVYSLIMLGVNIERAIQITNIIKIKFNDAKKAIGGYSKPVENSFEWTTLLKCCESYDMNRRFYKKIPDLNTSIEFIMLNPNFPRSIMNCLNQIKKHINQIDDKKVKDKTSASFHIGKLHCNYQFKTIDEIKEDLESFIEYTLDNLYAINKKIEKEYFYYS